jgi:hypothetical protein
MILIVDDHADTRIALVHILTLEGYSKPDMNGLQVL